MEWVVGTGRCGLHNYTALKGGWIQSKKEWKEMGLARYHNKEWDREHVKDVIQERKNLPYPCITDCAQFMFIDIIRQVDDNAKFVWIRRKDREKHIQSFMKRVGEESRIHPKGWEFKTSRKRELIEWYINEVENVIAKFLDGQSFKLIWTEDMPRANDEALERLREFA